MDTDLQARDLIRRSRTFASEDRSRSWRLTLTTHALLGLAIALGFSAAPLIVRIASSLFEALLLVRLTVLFHDHQHGAILRGSRLASFAMWWSGVLLLAPPSVWRSTHNHHHAHAGKLTDDPLHPFSSGTHIGSFALLTLEQWRELPRWLRWAYRAARHPLLILFAYPSVFLYRLCLSPLCREPRRHWDAALSLALHAALVALVAMLTDRTTVFLVVVSPCFIASASGALLFYVQHNFPSARVRLADAWSFAHAATEFSSFLDMHPVLHWFSANIAYHHVHHLNPRIPFYRLPEAMRALPELAEARVVRLNLRDLRACFAANLWDERSGCLVNYP